MLASGFRLRFEDPALERQFVEDYDQKNVWWIRAGGVLGALLGIGFGAIDAVIATESLFRAELIRAAIVVASIGTIACSYTAWWLNHQRNLTVLIMLAWGWGFAAMTLVGGFPIVYVSLGTAMLMIWLAALTRADPMRTAVGSLLILGALIWTLAAEGASTELWVLNLAFMLNFFTGAVLTAYLFERAARHAFLQQRLIRRYAPPAVAAAIETGQSTSIDTPQRRRVTVLFSDIVGFTDTADSMDPEPLAQIVNEYLAVMADIVERHGGTLNEFAGDGVMALFGAPAELPPEEQVAAAVAAATEIQDALPSLNERWAKLGLDHELKSRIGINTGMLSVGTFGSAGRATYTGIGLQTNIAARIQAHGSPGSILLSHASWQLVKDLVACEERGEAQVKGVHFPVKVYEPVGEPRVPGRR